MDRLNLILKMTVLLITGFISMQGVFGQTGNQQISGVVTDEYGEPLIGVSIVIKGTSTGVISDLDGSYSISAAPGSILVYTSLGMRPEERTVGKSSIMNVTLATNAELMDEVVVTAFATQKKVNVTGAISSVSGEDILSAPVSNISNALVGVTPGISAVQTGGEPGRNQADITIRGVATYGSSAPLIVIDGVEQAAEQAFTAFNTLDPNDIVSISVLKDASSTAVYGIRAANGVIIVTTKRGEIGRPKISFNANYGFTKATQLQKGISSAQWASMRNEAIYNEINGFGDTSLQGALYDEADLWKFRNNRDFLPGEVDAMSWLSDAQKQQLKNSDALYYGSHDLYSEQFGEYGPQWQANVNISGGTEKVKYFVSVGYFNQQGITQRIKYYGADSSSSFERYNFRTNVDMDIIKNTTISVDISGQFGTTKGPGVGSDPDDIEGRYTAIMQYIYDGNPFMTPGIIDGHLISGFDRPAGSVQQVLYEKTASTVGDQNAVYNLLTAGTGTTFNSLLNGTLKLRHQFNYLLDGLSLQASINYQDNYNKYVTVSPSIPSYQVRRSADNPNELEYFGGSLSPASFSSTAYSNWNKLYLDAGLYYNNTFNGHSVGALILWKASMYTMPNDSHNTPSGIMGLVGRVTYDYRQRYMAEFNMGYNGTEQFAEGKRFGFFPAFSLGWVPTNEPFFPKNDILTFLKIRGSYGEVGNDMLGSSRYLYLPNTYSLDRLGYYLGTSDGSSENAYYAGATEESIGNPNVTWEKARKYDIGAELRFFNDRLYANFDYFHEDRRNILTRLGIIPGTYGVSADKIPPVNVGVTKNHGYEVIVGWKDRVGNFSYEIEANYSYARNKIIYKAEAPNPYDWMNETGHSIGQSYGLKTDGLYDTVEELNSRPYNTFTGGRATLGDIKYIDLNGDGLIDNKDYAPIGYPNRPLSAFGLRLGFHYKGWDLNMLFSGTAQGSFYIRRISIPYYKNAGNAFKWQYDGRWTPEKYAAGETITYPRATYNATTTSHNFLDSDYWMIPNDHFKLKNIELGYTLPSRLLKKAKISSVRFYATGNNVYTFFSRLKKIGIDPETKSTENYSYVYPITSTFILGVTIQY